MSASTNVSPVSAAGVAEASARQVQQWLRAGKAVLVDVREADEHARERIAGSVLLPLSRFDAGKIAAMVGPEQTVVIHCRSGRRGSDACRLAASMASRGVSVVNMTGGIEAWKKEALPVELNAAAPGISVMRQVQLVIGACVLIGSGLAWLVDPAFIGIPAFFGAGLLFAGASGTCGMATVIGMMPWNRARGGSCGAESCGTGSCG